MSKLEFNANGDSNSRVWSQWKGKALSNTVSYVGLKC